MYVRGLHNCCDFEGFGGAGFWWVWGLEFGCGIDGLMDFDGSENGCGFEGFGVPGFWWVLMVLNFDNLLKGFRNKSYRRYWHQILAILGLVQCGW